MGARRDKKAVSAGPTSVADLPTVNKLVTAKTHKGRRILEKRASKPIEDAKKVLILYGNKASQVLKDVLVDLHKLKRGESIKFTRRNEECRPFEVGGEQRLEFYANKAECGLFALGSHTKKRPHNLVLGRFFDGHLLDAIEMGVQGFASINSFGAKATGAALGSKPCILFVGEKFESVPALKLAKSLVLDLFRGEQVSAINLAGLDRVLVAYAVEDDKLLLRQYVIKFKKSGTRTPKVALEEMGPSLDLHVRRHRPAPHDMEKEAMKKPLIGKKKEKNVSSDSLMGKVGRIYMPKQQVDGMALAKPKGTKRERRNDTAERKAKKNRPESAAGPGPEADAPDAADV